MALLQQPFLNQWILITVLKRRNGEKLKRMTVSSKVLLDVDNAS